MIVVINDFVVKWDNVAPVKADRFEAALGPAGLIINVASPALIVAASNSTETQPENTSYELAE